jgi:cob(I)alamin adenosyltransferase
MGHRLSKIYTRTGDAGTTGLGNGNRVSKNSLRIHTLGEVDEANAAIGIMLCEELPEDVRALLTNVQHDLFDLGGEVCIPGMEMITAKQVQYLEDELDRFNDDLEPLKDFILPGGTRAAALSHQARTIYLNRLSDLLFVLGRVLNRAGGRGDVLWQKRKNA